MYQASCKTVMPSDGMLQAMASAIPVSPVSFTLHAWLGLLVLILQLCLKTSVVHVKAQHRVHDKSQGSMHLEISGQLWTFQHVMRSLPTATIVPDSMLTETLGGMQDGQ